MDQAIYISSSSEDEFGDDQSLFDEAGNFQEELLDGEPFAAFFHRGIPEELFPDRLPKKQRIHGPENAALDQVLPSPLASRGLYPSQSSMAAAADGNDQLFLQILEIFPGISHTYVKDLIGQKVALRLGPDFKARGFDLAILRDAIYEEILGQKSYPKQDSENPKRKREESEEAEANWERATQNAINNPEYFEAASAFLGPEFPWVPMSHIKKVLSDKGRLYHAFVALYSDDNLLEQRKYQYVKLKSQRSTKYSKKHTLLRDTLTREINAARKHVEKLQTTVRKKMEEEEAEKANEKEYMRTGNLIECQCCYSDVPANRCLPCEGYDLHFFCFTCIRRSADTQIGMMKYTLQCFDISGCQAPFDRRQLKEVLSPSVIEKLDSLQQEDEIRKAGLEGLEDCPFCSYKAVLPPIEEDREFRCENSSCKVVSCRLCKEKSHVPQTCEEFRKDKGLSERHQVEEAMSNALIRKCPKCQLKIIKEYGCNKMQCTKCHTLMCYVCQTDITKEGYAHFGRGGCPQDDIHTQDRDHREIQRAERAAIDKILAENPDISEEQIRVGHEKPNNQRRGAHRDPRIHPAFQMRDAMRAMRADIGGFYPQQHQHPNNRPPVQREFPVYPPPAYNVPYPMDYGAMFNPPFPDFNVFQRRFQPGNLPAQPAVMHPMVGLANPPADIHPQNFQNLPTFQPQRRLPQDPNAAYRGGGFGPF
ncbi:hypothetical protein BDW71DRAFT_25897 [Aspergillus fruticulosus]